MLHYLEPAVCQALVPELNSLFVLERLFVVPVPGVEARWRYHPVLAEILRLRLLRERPDDFLRLHLAASSWYESQGRMIAAIDHALAGGDHPHAAGLMAGQAMLLLSEGRLRLLARWFAALPINVLRQQPRLIPVKLWTPSFTQGPAEAMRQLDLIGEEAVASEPAVQTQLPALRCS